MSSFIRVFGLAMTAAGVVAAASPSLAAKADDSLMAAVRNDNVAAAKLALKQHASPNALAPDGSAPLAWAVDRGDADMVGLLLKAGAKTNIGNGAVSLILACENGNDAVISLLLDAHADVNARRADGVSAFHLCASRASTENLSRMIDAGASLDTPNAEGQTALMFAAAAGNAQNVALLLGHHADVKAVTKGGFTPLFFAAKGSSTKAVQALLDAGANNGYMAPDGTTALQLALLVNDVPVATILVEHGATLVPWDINGKQPLHVAVANGDGELAKLMIAKGADLNGLTRLAYRVDPGTDKRAPGSARVTRIADRAPDDATQNAAAAQRVTDQRGGGGGGQAARDPLYYDTSKLGYQPKIVLGQLDWAGSVADPAPPTTPLLVAAAAGRADMMKLLVEAGANKDFRTDDGNSLTLAAVSSGSLDAVKYALTVSPDIKVAKKDGTTGGRSRRRTSFRWYRCRRSELYWRRLWIRPAHLRQLQWPQL